jgi:hypothetical protein
VKVNVVSSIHSSIWKNQLEILDDLKYEFVFTESPIEADVTIIYGKLDSMKVFSPSSNTAFILTEPPEIIRYTKKFLSQFGVIAGPDFGYIPRELNQLFISPAIPNHIGVDYSSSEPILENLRSLSETSSPYIDAVSVITSGKKITKMQRQRLRFISELQRAIPQKIRLYGRDDARILDKSEALTVFKYHLALENSTHKLYWTEKLSDAVLCRNLIFYSGDPSILDYFDSESVIPVDIWDIKGSIEKITQVIDANSYSQSLASIESNRRQIIENFSIVNVVQRILDELPNSDNQPKEWMIKEMKSVPLMIGRLKSLFSRILAL